MLPVVFRASFILCKSFLKYECYSGNRNNSFFIIIIIIIITLFQEDNIFGRVASLTYGPQLTNVGHDIINEQTCMYNYLQYVQS